jgi:hypothetical protein
MREKFEETDFSKRWGHRDGMIWKNLLNRRLPLQPALFHERGDEDGGHRLGVRTEVPLVIGCGGDLSACFTYAHDTDGIQSFAGHDRAAQSGDAMFLPDGG